ncbi:MAG TPA: hypothetical protein VIK13_14825 [Candidatus Limnocylindrales bacterium]
MNSGDPFDREVRRTLDAMAGEPAPERLVARVAAIPRQEPVMQTFRSRLRLGTLRPGAGFGGLAVALAIVVAAVIVRPAIQAPGGPGSSLNATVPSASAPSTGAPPSAVSSPSAPAASPSAASPSAASPSAASPSAAPAAIGFAPVSVTFISTDAGWALGSVPCGSTRCAAIERTKDGGRTWAPAPAPKTAVVPGIGLPASAGAGIGRLRFATANDGWAFGPDLWATHDGGASWTRASVPGLPAGSVMVALETANGSVHAAFYDGAQDFGIAVSPVGSDAWSVSPLRLPVGAGPVPAVQLVLSGNTGWLLQNDRTVVNGAHLVGGVWRTWTPPCADVAGPAAIAASSPTDLVAACDVGSWSSPQGGHLFVSRDGGTAFTETGGRVPVALGSEVAMADTSAIVVSGSNSTGSVLAGTFDGGQTWSVVLQEGSGPLGLVPDVRLAELGFTTPTQGVVVASLVSGSGQLLMTRDGGHTWSAVTF